MLKNFQVKDSFSEGSEEIGQADKYSLVRGLKSFSFSLMLMKIEKPFLCSRVNT